MHATLGRMSLSSSKKLNEKINNSPDCMLLRIRVLNPENYFHNDMFPNPAGGPVAKIFHQKIF